MSIQNLNRAIMVFCFFTLASFTNVNAEESKEAGPKVSGFVDFSAGGQVSGDDKKISLGLDQAEIDIEYSAKKNLNVRVDVEYTEDGEDATAVAVEQAYFEYFLDSKESGAYIAAGKWNAPIGIESIDPTDMDQFSHGLLFTNAAPSNLTGLKLGYNAESFNAQVWLSNGWDKNRDGDNHYLGGRLELPFTDGHIGASGTYGPTSKEKKEMLVDVDLAYTIDDLTIKGEFNMQSYDGNSGTGFLGKAIYALNEDASLTVRYDSLDTTDLGKEITANNKSTKLGNKASSVTGALGYALTDGLFGVAEFRHLMPDEGDAVSEAAVELTASF